ncbi:MarR family winged helix-turn-helix transcriptional regulator [Afifella sp. IM 167]|uniref:MarR family winged helix-turn-helix transcriptional regulator n=1 Tax=Afifella sp. IM 167 TaxID=2033586 RepID=UPI001CCE40F0|nr:MarR family transcriptional regulator [Afifella sp. IM 167]MBZ8131820.1 MarR family transcriptional regulator [Afifella sp. IM 167]
MIDDPYPFEHPANALILEVFRLNGALIAAGDDVVKPLGLTSARWQVMGSVAQGKGGFTVAQLARNMGLARQSVQRIVDEMLGAGIFELAENPAHKRAKLVRPTKEGERLFEAALFRWLPLADALAEEAGAGELQRMTAVLQRLRVRLEGEPGEGGER